MTISIKSSEIKSIPDAISKLVPTMDVTALKTLLSGVSFPSTGTITLLIALTPSDTLEIILNAIP